MDDVEYIRKCLENASVNETHSILSQFSKNYYFSPMKATTEFVGVLKNENLLVFDQKGKQVTSINAVAFCFDENFMLYIMKKDGIMEKYNCRTNKLVSMCMHYQEMKGINDMIRIGESSFIFVLFRRKVVKTWYEGNLRQWKSKIITESILFNAPIGNIAKVHVCNNLLWCLQEKLGLSNYNVETTRFINSLCPFATHMCITPSYTGIICKKKVVIMNELFYPIPNAFPTLENDDKIMGFEIMEQNNSFCVFVLTDFSLVYGAYNQIQSINVVDCTDICVVDNKLFLFDGLLLCYELRNNTLFPIF